MINKTYASLARLDEIHRKIAVTKNKHLHPRSLWQDHPYGFSFWFYRMNEYLYGSRMHVTGSVGLVFDIADLLVELSPQSSP